MFHALSARIRNGREHMAFTGPAEDRLAIRELYGTYGDASWRGDREQWVSCFTEDGRWTSHLFESAGRAALLQTSDGLWQDWATVAFLGELGAMETEGHTARVRSHASTAATRAPNARAPT